MHPTGEQQFQDATAGRLPAAEVFRDGICSIPLPRPGPPPYTLCYALTDSRGAVHLIDPGVSSEENWALLGDGIAMLGRTMEDVATVTVTHLHSDHLGMAARIARFARARVAMHGAEQSALNRLLSTGPPIPSLARWGVPADAIAPLLAVARGRDYPAIAADRLLSDGGTLDIPGRVIRVIHTPGHTAGHIVLRDEREGLLFTGDHLLPDIFPGIGLGGETEHALMDYFSSLTRIGDFDDDEACPGHGYRFREISSRVDETRTHQVARTREVARIVLATPAASVWEVATNLSWTRGWEGLSTAHRLSALQQTEMRMVYLGG